MTDQTLSDDAMQEVQSLVLVCLGAADPERELEQRTADRPHLRPMVRQILTRAQQGGSSEQIGHFHIVRQLGAGGMGAVYLAEQKEPIARTVALKLIKLGMDTDEVLRRFEFERQTLALMNHDNIARVFDAGRTPRGQPYFAMEYVPGTPLTKFADQHTLSIEARLELMLQVCAGVLHAHQRGVVHRDLKPANILVVEQDGRGVPKIIDFGLARATEQQRRDVTQLTSEGSALGTPAYMSPEQTGMTDDAVDTRSDVYALGVILYELLTGELPFSQEELLARSPLEMLRMIREVEPSRPSRKLALRSGGAEEIARLRATSGTTLLAALRRDLDWIVMLALRKERDQRYASVGDLAADLRRFLADEPVSATAPSTIYRVGKLLRRYRVQAIAAGVVLLCLVAGLVVSLGFFFDASFEKDRNDPLVLIALQQEAERDLWPIHPSRVDRMQRWLERAGELRARAGVQRSYLTTLEAQEAGARAAGAAPAPRLLEQIREQRAFLDGLARLQDSSAAERLADTVAGVTARLDAARTLAARTIEAYRAAWDDARAAIKASDDARASALYRGLDLPPQLGLVPLGMDPTSKLWEFYHVDSGAPGAPLPSRDGDGRIAMRQEIGFVFVLLPCGTFMMGADKEHDPKVERDETPRHEVTLAPFFISKFECTQAQWRRLAATTPSRYHAGYSVVPGHPVPTWTNPVEQVLFPEVITMCARVGVEMCTEAQWEYACRAGSDTIYSFGNDGEGLRGFENVADKFAADKARGWAEFEPWEDGHIVHAPVGTFAPNRFGLYDMHGNVGEMCRDVKLPYSVPVRAGDGLREGPSRGADEQVRVSRGGCWLFARVEARCAARGEAPPRAASDSIGFRPSRSIRGAGE